MTLALLAPYRQSTDGTKSKIKVTIEEQDLEWPQSHSMNSCLKRYGHENTWLIFTDIDEFIVFPEGESLKRALTMERLKWLITSDRRNKQTGQETVDALCLGWKIMDRDHRGTIPTMLGLLAFSTARSFTICYRPIPSSHREKQLFSPTKAQICVCCQTVTLIVEMVAFVTTAFQRHPIARSSILRSAMPRQRVGVDLAKSLGKTPA